MEQTAVVISRDISSQRVGYDNLEYLRTFQSDQIDALDQVDIYMESVIELASQSLSYDLTIKDIALIDNINNLAKIYGALGNMDEEDIFDNTQQRLEGIFVDNKLKRELLKKIAELRENMSIIDENLNRTLTSSCTRMWFTLEIPDSYVLGNIFAYYNPRLQIRNGQWAGETFVYIQSIETSIYLILAKMIYSDIQFPNIYDELLQSCVDFAFNMGSHLVLANVNDKQELINRGFSTDIRTGQGKTRSTKDVLYDSCLAGTINIDAHTVYYEL